MPSSSTHISSSPLLLGLEVVEKNGALLRLLTPVLDYDARAVDNLACVPFAVQNTYHKSAFQKYHRYLYKAHTETGPLAQLLAIGHLDQGNLVFVAQGNDELLVGIFLARLVKNAHVCLSAIEGFRSFAEATGEAIVHEGETEDTLEGIENGHLPLGGGVG